MVLPGAVSAFMTLSILIGVDRQWFLTRGFDLGRFSVKQPH